MICWPAHLVIVVELVIILVLLFKGRHQRVAYINLSFIIDGKRSTMPATIKVGKTATAVLTEFDAQGNAVAPVTPPAYQSSNPAVATVDPASGIATGVAPGTTTISGADAGDGLSASDTLTVEDVATTAKLTLTAN